MRTEERLEILQCMQLIIQNIPEADKYWRNASGCLTYETKDELLYTAEKDSAYYNAINQWCNLIRDFY